MRLKLMLSLLCFCVASVGAQDTVSGNEEYGEMSNIGISTPTGQFFPKDVYQKYEFPVQNIECNGHDFEAKAVVTYNYDKDKKTFYPIFLQVYLKPLDVEGMKNANHITNSSYYGTLVYHDGLEGNGPVKKFKGTAEAFARTFSPYPATVGDELKLEYSVVFDVENPDKCKDEYKLYKSLWPQPDENVFISDDARLSYLARWDDTAISFDKFRLFNESRENFWDSAALEAKLTCIKPQPIGGTEKYDDMSSNPGRIMGYVDFDIRGMKGDTTMGQPIVDFPYYKTRENNMLRYAVGAKENGEVTIEENMYIRLGYDQRFLDSVYGDRYGFKFRAHAKCNSFLNKHYENRKSMRIERVALTYMLYN